MGTPDVNGDGVPDMWTLLQDGSVRVYHATPTWGGSPSTVITGAGKTV